MTLIKSFIKFIKAIFISLESLLYITIYTLKFGFAKQNNIKKHSNTCVVMGNGPSLKDNIEKDQELLSKTDILVVNFFIKNQDFYSIKPRYYLLLDPLFLKREIYDGQEGLFEKIEDMKSKITWEITFIVPLHWKNTTLVGKYLHGSPLVNVQFFSTAKIKGFKSISHYLNKRGLGLPQCQNVLVSALFLMTRLKYQNIILLGAESDWHKNISVDNNNDMYLQNTHFYGEEKKKMNSTMSSMFLSIHLAMKGYENVRDFANYMGVSITNSTPNSAIDAFKKRDIKTVV